MESHIFIVRAFIFSRSKLCSRDFYRRKPFEERHFMEKTQKYEENYIYNNFFKCVFKYIILIFFRVEKLEAFLLKLTAITGAFRVSWKICFACNLPDIMETKISYLFNSIYSNLFFHLLFIQQ